MTFNSNFDELLPIFAGASCVSLTVITKISGQSKHIPGTQEVDVSKSLHYIANTM